jgi:hypothetical protein
MRNLTWGSTLVLPLALMSLACGGTAFTTDTDAGTGSSGGGSSGASGSGSSGTTSSGGSSGSGSSSSGGGSSSGSGSGSSGSSGGIDGGDEPPCPAHVPTAKTSCSPQGLVCEYGVNPVEGCDPLSTCQGTWQTTAPTDSMCSATLGAGCPLTFEAVPQGATCSDDGLVCNYPRGRCACVVSSFGPPVKLQDASVAGQWACQDPGTADCPVPRAPLGSACTKEGLECDYGVCSVPGGTAQECEGGIWKPSAVACAVAQ